MFVRNFADERMTNCQRVKLLNPGLQPGVFAQCDPARHDVELMDV